MICERLLKTPDEQLSQKSHDERCKNQLFLINLQIPIYYMLIYEHLLITFKYNIHIFMS